MATLTMNELFYNRYIKNSLYLKDIIYQQDRLVYKDKNVIFKTSSDLANLPVVSFNIENPYFFLNVLEVNLYCNNEYDKMNEEFDADLTDNQKIIRHFFPIRNILNKDTISEEDLTTINSFLVVYNNLVISNGYLEDKAINQFKEMSNILNWTLDNSNFKKNNFAQQKIREYINQLNKGNTGIYINTLNDNTGEALDKGISRVRTNPNLPPTIPNDDNGRLNSYGYLSFFILLYAAFNLLVTLVILAIKK